MDKKVARDLKHWGTRLRHGGTPDAVRALREQAAAWAGSMRVRLQAEMQRVGVEYGRLWARWFTDTPSVTPAPLYYQTLAATLLDLGGWALLLLEAGLSAALMVLLTAIRPVVAALIGIVAALALCFGAKALFTPTLARYEETPLAARDRLLAMLVPLGVVEFVLLGLALLIRAVSSDDWAEPLAPLFGVALGILSVTTPLLGALLLLLARLYGWSRHLAREYARLEHLDRDLEDLLPAGNGQQVGAGQDKGDGAAGAAPLARVACLVAALLGGTPLLGVAATPPAGLIFGDVSPSMSPVHRRAAFDAITEALPHISMARETYTWKLIAFAEDGWDAAPSYTVTLPTPENPGCPTIRLREAELVFKGLGAKRLKRAQDECDQRRTAAVQSHHRAVNRAVQDLREVLAGLRSRPARCTAVLDALHRAALSPPRSTVLLVTDGWESCRHTVTHLPAPTEGTVVLVIVVSPRALPAASGAAHFTARAAYLGRVAPWARVVPPWRVADEFPSTALPVPSVRRVATTE